MSIATVAPLWSLQILDDDGVPVAGAKIYSYQAGTSTPQACYTDSLLTIPFTNPIVCLSNGRTDGPVYLLTTPAYKFVVTDADGVVVIPETDAIIASAPAS